MTHSALGTAAAGRPRDPEVDQRILRAAAEVVGEDAWSKFTVDSVSERAGVGKTSIYLRWPNKKDLLASALEAQISPVAAINTGTNSHDQRAGLLIAVARPNTVCTASGAAGWCRRRSAADAGGGGHARAGRRNSWFWCWLVGSPARGCGSPVSVASAWAISSMVARV